MRKELTGVKDNNEHINMNKNGEMKNERNATKLQQMVRIELSLVGGEAASIREDLWVEEGEFSSETVAVKLPWHLKQNIIDEHPKADLAVGCKTKNYGKVAENAFLSLKSQMTE